jgi:hypothetical protein
MGVSITPWAVSIRPARAEVAVSIFSILNFIQMTHI